MRLNEVTSCHMMLHEVTLVLMRPAKACGVTWGWLRSHGATWGLGHMRLVNWGSVRSTEVTKVTVHRSAEVTWSQMLGECCRLCLDVVHLLKSKRKVLNKGLILIICHCLFLHIFCICPGSGSGFVSLHTDPVPDPTFIIQIRTHKSGSATLWIHCWLNDEKRNEN